MVDDPLWSSVQLLASFDGGYSDSSAAARKPVATLAPLNSGNVKFGASSLDTSAGSSSRLVFTPSIAIGTQPFTVECFARINGTWPGGAPGLVSQWNSGNNWFFGFDSGAGNGLVFYINGTNFTLHTSAAVNPADNLFHHYCVDRDATNTVRLYVDGVVKATFASVTDNITNTGPLTVGNDGANTHSWPGQIDEARVTVGAARYGAAFTPTTTAFPGGGNAALAPTTLVPPFIPGRRFMLRAQSFLTSEVAFSNTPLRVNRVNREVLASPVIVAPKVGKVFRETLASPTIVPPKVGRVFREVLVSPVVPQQMETRSYGPPFWPGSMGFRRQSSPFAAAAAPVAARGDSNLMMYVVM